MATRAALDLFRAVYKLKSLKHITLYDDDRNILQSWYDEEEGYYPRVVTFNFNEPAGTMLLFHHFTPHRAEICNRGGIIVTTPVGNVCVFERFNGGRDNVLVADMPRCIGQLIQANDRVLEEHHVRLLFGIDTDIICESDHVRNNIGKQLETILGIAVRNGELKQAV